jgi:hypothetical protein
MLCETKFLIFFHYSAATTLILHFDWYCTGNYSFFFYFTDHVDRVSVCVFVTRVIYILLCKYDSCNIIYNIYKWIKNVHRSGAVTVEGLHTAKNNSFPPPCVKGSEAHLCSTPKNVSTFLFTYFIYICMIIIIVLPRPLHAYCNINMLQYYAPLSIRDEVQYNT